MPRPRSSTFYLPLAPIDAPLELKAKLSVLPPSAANALLAPRNHPNPPPSCLAGFSRSATETATATTGTTPAVPGSGACPSSSDTGSMYNTREDECTRLNRVLGIPQTTQHAHTHITLPQPSSSSSLNIPTQGTGRRRHTDAPKPSLPLSRSHPSPLSPPRASPLVSTSFPSDQPAYFPTTTTTTGNPAPAPAPANWSVPPTHQSQHSTLLHQSTTLPPSASRLSSISETKPSNGTEASIHASIADDHPSVIHSGSITTATAITTTTTVMGAAVTDNTDDDLVDQTEVSMAWTSTSAAGQDQDRDRDREGRFEEDAERRRPSDLDLDTEQPPDVEEEPEEESNTSVQIGHGNGAVDMDLFVGACEVQNPVVFGSPPRRTLDPLDDPPSRRTLESLDPIQPLRSTLPLEHAQPPPSTKPQQRTTKPLQRTTRPLESTPPPPPPTAPTHARPPLSYIPCGMHNVLACKTKVPSRFAPSPPPLLSSSRPSTSTSAGTGTSTTSLSASSTTIILTPKLAIRPPQSDSLHPTDTRHLLNPQFRLSFPPPPAPLPLAKDAHPREEACMFVDESIPGLVDIHARFSKSTQQDSQAAQQQQQQQPSSSSSHGQYSESTQPAAAKVAPRQRFRLAPLYLPRVLRRSLGATAWARLEALRAARAAERTFGWAVAVDGTMPVPLGFTPGTGAWSSAFGDTHDAQGNSLGGFTGGAWWDRVVEQQQQQHQSECGGNSLVWSGYEDLYAEEDVDMQGVEDAEEGEDDNEGEAPVTEGCLWDWDDEDVEPVLIQGQGQPQQRRQGEEMDEDEFVHEGAPEPEERRSPLSSPSYSTPPTPSGPEGAGYSMVGKFGWNTTWPASPTSPVSPTHSERPHFQTVDIPGLDAPPPVTLGLPPVPRRAVRREDGAEEEEEDEEIFRYSPLKVEEDPTFYGEMDVEEEEQGGQVGYLHTGTGSMSSCSTPTATSPSFPPEPLRGVAISSSFEEGYLQGSQEFYDADGDAEMEEAPSRPPIRAPRPLSLVQHPVLHHQYHEDAPSPPPSRVFVIPPSPLTTTSFDTGGSSTPTSATAPAPPFPDQMEEEGDLSNVGWSTASVERGLSPRRSYERIVAPRPQRASRGMEQVFSAASTSSPVYRTSTLAQSPPPQSPPSSSSSPRIPSTSSPRWTFGSLKSALSNSVSQLVELATSRSPSPLPWLIRSSTSYTGSTLSGVAAALEASNSSHRRDGSEEELESERSTSCVTPTPTVGSHSRRSSTTTITGASSSRLPVLTLQVDNPGTDAMMSESPPPKRTLSTSSLSSLGSEPDSESGSSGGIFSRSPSPEPTSDSRIWDPSYTLTPRSRPISADAKAAAACGGRLSPMMIPGSWDPAELWAEEGDLAKTW